MVIDRSAKAGAAIVLVFVIGDYGRSTRIPM